MDTFKVSISWVVTSFAKCFKTSLHKSAYTTTKYCLLTKEVCFCFCSECCFKNTSSCSTDTSTISKCHIKCLTCFILFYSYKTRCSFSCLIFTSYCMTWSFRCYHCYIYALWCFDKTKVNVETMSKH